MQPMQQMLDILETHATQLPMQPMQQMLDILETHARARLGAPAVQRIDTTTPTSVRYAAVQAFKQSDSPVQLFLMTMRSCGLGTDMPRVNVVVLFDSDWRPRLDMQVRVCGQVENERGGAREGESGR